MRLPRAEDEIVMFISVDGEPLRVEGRISRITLENHMSLLRNSGLIGDRRVRGSITVELRSIAEVEDETEVVEVQTMEGTVVVYEVPAPDPLPMDEVDRR